MSQYLTGKFDKKENNDNDRKKWPKSPLGWKSIGGRERDWKKERNLNTQRVDTDPEKIKLQPMVF